MNINKLISVYVKKYVTAVDDKNGEIPFLLEKKGKQF
jgi:hypothetical protein